MLNKNRLYTSHKTWCEKIGNSKAECNCDGVPSPNQQLLALTLQRLVAHSKETLALMETCKTLAEQCAAERRRDAERNSIKSRHADWCNTQRPIPHGALAERGPCNCNSSQDVTG